MNFKDPRDFVHLTKIKDFVLKRHPNGLGDVKINVTPADQNRQAGVQSDRA